MTAEEVRSKIQELVIYIFELDPKDSGLNDEVPLQYLGDSLQYLQLVAEIQRQFAVSFDPVRVRTLGQLVTLIERKVGLGCTA